MVLEEAVTAPDVSGDDTSPTSDIDPYSSTPGPTSGASSISIEIDLNKLASPIPFIGPIIGFTRANLGQNINASVANMANVVKRPLTSDEVQALAFHSAKATAIASYGLPLGVVGGLWRAANTRSTFRFPFWQPDLEKMDLKKLGPLTGARAEYGWQFLRRFSYAGIGGWLGKVLVGTYAATVAATGTRLDSRMKDIVEAIRKLGNQEALRRTRTPSPSNANTDTGDNTDQNASPSSSMPELLDEGRDRINGTNTGVLSDRQMRTEESRRQADHSRAGALESKTSTLRMEKVASQPSDFDFDYASPTAGNELPSGGSGGMTAWERLRKGQSPPSSQTRDDRSAENYSGSSRDNYNSSKSDEERQLAKAEAQKDFDEKLEWERRGQNFDSDRTWR